MGFKTKVQLIKRTRSEQWYVNFPSALAQAIEFSKGEVVEWVVEEKELLGLKRPEAPPRLLKNYCGGVADNYFHLWGECRDAFESESVWQRAVRLGTGSLLCLAGTMSPA